jgi:hypothetical protein
VSARLLLGGTCGSPRPARPVAHLAHRGSASGQRRLLLAVYVGRRVEATCAQPGRTRHRTSRSSGRRLRIAGPNIRHGQHGGNSLGVAPPASQGTTYYECEHASRRAAFMRRRHIPAFRVSILDTYRTLARCGSGADPRPAPMPRPGNGGWPSQQADHSITYAVGDDPGLPLRRSRGRVG